MRAIRLFLTFLLFAALLVGALGSGASSARADENNPDVIPTFVDALNRGDTGLALQLSSPSLVLILPNGQSFTVSASTPFPAALLPITIISLDPQGVGSQTVDAVLTFGSDPTRVRVEFKGEGGVIVSIRVLGP